jgi:hypothetical protein
MFFYTISKRFGMQKKTPLQKLSATVSPLPDGDALSRVVAIAPAPVLPGENEFQYVKMAERIVEEAQPADAIEEILVRDVVDLTWEVFRARRFKAGVLRASIGSGVRMVLDAIGYGSFGYNRELGERWAAGNKSARREVNAALRNAGLTIDEITAKTAEEKIDTLERLDRMLASAEARRNNAIREIDRHREALGGAAKSAIDEIEDAEFREVESGDQGERKSCPPPGDATLISPTQRRAPVRGARSARLGRRRTPCATA